MVVADVGTCVGWDSSLAVRIDVLGMARGGNQGKRATVTSERMSDDVRGKSCEMYGIGKEPRRACRVSCKRPGVNGAKRERQEEDEKE